MDQNVRHRLRSAALAASAAPGRREVNKADKLKRIKTAARLVFVSKGYDEATTREMAARAKVAIGTLFLYATGKRDLLFLAVNDDYDDVAERAAAAIAPDAPLLDNLTAMFRPLYVFFAADPKLSRMVLREMLFYETGTQTLRFAAARDRMVEICAEVVGMAKRSGQIRSPDSAELVGGLIFSVYQVEVRRWLADEPLSVARGLQRLRQLLSVLIEGLLPKPSAFSIDRKGTHTGPARARGSRETRGPRD